MVRNGFELDFCFKECIESLLPVCDKVLVCDGESTDGTQEFIRDWMQREPKLVLCVYPWPNPKNDWEFFFRWINYARQHVPCDYQFQIDADEILSEKSYPEVERLKAQMIAGHPPFSVVCRRHNFWRDHRHTIPHGQCLGHEVIRIAPQNIPLASDGFHPEGTQAPQIAIPSSIEIFHYGFIRSPKAFFKKERLLQNYFFGTYDTRLERVENVEGNWMDDPGVSAYSATPDKYDGDHPEIIKPWLRERGYELP